MALLLALGLVGTPAVAQDNLGSTSADRENEKVIRTLYDQFEEAWNRHDTAAMAKMWSIDGDHLEPDGTLAKGREGVSQLFAREHDTVFKETQLSLTIDDVWFITGEVALVDGGYEVEGVRTPDGQVLPPRRGHLSAILLKEQGQWWIVASRLMIPSRLPYKKGGL
jgi:uncharacterized protein (TIGR02246 family)